MQSDLVPVKRIFENYLPHAEITRPNPVYKFDLRRIGRRSDPGRLLSFSLGLIIIPTILTSALIFIFSRESRAIMATGSSGSAVYVYFSWAQVIGLFGLLATAGSLFIGNLYYLLVSVTSINRLKESGDWDILRLTAVPENDLVQAKHVIVEIRAWRMMVVEIALRMAGLAFLFSHAIMFLRFSYIQFNSLPFMFTLLSVPLLWSFLYAVEPLWRMRTVTAIGLASSAEFHSVSNSTLVGFGAVLAMYVLELILIVSVIWVWYNALAITVGLDRGIDAGENFFGEIASILLSVGSVLVVRYFYKLLRGYAVRRATRTAFRSE